MPHRIRWTRSRRRRRSAFPPSRRSRRWDNLTNKGHCASQPDMVTVWNEQQKREAVDAHGIAGRPGRGHRRAAVRSLVRAPSRASRASDSARWSACPTDRDRSCCTPARRCSSRASAVEVPFARRWIAGAARQRATRLLRDAAVLIRPHPFNVDGVADHGFQRSRPGCDLSDARATPRPPIRRARASSIRCTYSAGDRRHEHERDGRGGHPRQAGAVAADAGIRGARRKARCTSITCCRRTAASSAWRTPSTSTSRN